LKRLLLNNKIVDHSTKPPNSYYKDERPQTSRNSQYRSNSGDSRISKENKENNEIKDFDNNKEIRAHKSTPRTTRSYPSDIQSKV